MAARLATLLLLVAALLCAATLKLYLKGGGDLLVTEYAVEDDRVRYYSVERRQWEEIPVDLVDLERTEQAMGRTQRRLESMRADSAAERKAERKALTELHDVPIEEGVYYYSNGAATEVQQQEVVIEGVKKRKFLQVISPIPVFAGKKKLYVEGEHAELVVKEDKPVFYVRQSKLTLFGIVKATVEKKRRVMQIMQTVPQAQEIYEEQQEIEVFRQQLAAGVYRVWPVEPLEPGEYAVVDFTPGEANLRAWPFRAPSGADASDPSS